MPGGSVNGRPFREGADAYSNTGIPCGNPRRYQSRDVVKMGVQNQRALSRPLVGPAEDIETEGERQLQNLLHKQLRTDMTIHEHMQQHKRFSDAVVHQSPVDALSGTVSLDEYKGLSEVDQYVLGLKHCRLTPEEIQIKLEDMGMITVNAKKLRLNLEPGTRKKMIDIINRKIEEKKKELENSDSFSGVRTMGRHEMDLENSISHNSNRAKFLSCLLTTTQSNMASQSDDPMDHLPEILSQVNKQAKGTRRRKRTLYGLHKSDTSMAEASEKIESYDDTEPTVNTSSEPFIGPLPKPEYTHSCKGAGNDSPTRTSSSPTRTSSSLREAANLYSPASVDSRTTFHSSTSGPDVALYKHNPESRTCPDMQECSGERDRSDRPAVHGDSVASSREREPRVLSERIEPIPEQEIIRNRLSLEQVREIPRFRDYSPGEPSTVLYLKNLPGQVREEDLVGLFVRFQPATRPRILFKLMKGRMKGQAFVTLDSEDTASKALHLLNGYLMKGRPLIIQFGKGRSAP